MGSTAIYRVRQFLRAAGAFVRPGGRDVELASHFLPPEALSLFAAMPRYDRRHALDVLDSLREEGHAEPELMAAALLHDAGKTPHQRGPLQLWHRVVVVLLRALAPGQLDRIARDEMGSWRQPFFVQQHHAAIGADMARQAGCSPATVTLICRHEEPPGEMDDPLLAALQTADGSN